MSLEHSPARSGVRVLRRKQILEMFGISNTTLWEWVRTGKFPAPIDLGPNTRAWLAEEVDAFLLQRAKERPQQLELLTAADAE